MSIVRQGQTVGTGYGMSPTRGLVEDEYEWDYEDVDAIFFQRGGASETLSFTPVLTGYNTGLYNEGPYNRS